MTCKNTEVTNSDIILLCQTIVLRDKGDTFDISWYGDSGSPVFKFTYNSENTSLAGALWGGNPDDSTEKYFVFSPMPNIEYELGTLSTTPTIGIGIP